MMAMLALMAANALPVPPKPAQEPLFKPTESSSDEGAVVYTAFIDAKGKPMDCTISGVVGKDFGGRVCETIMAKRFQPAQGTDGKPAYGAIRGVVNFRPANAGQSDLYPVKLRPDLSLTVKPVPGLMTSKDVNLAVVVNGAGHITECGPASGADARLAAAACGPLKAQWAGTSLEFPEGSPQNYVLALTVSFEPDVASR